MAHQRGHCAHPKPALINRAVPIQGPFHHAGLPVSGPSPLQPRTQPCLHPYGQPHPQWMHAPIQQPLDYPPGARHRWIMGNQAPYEPTRQRRSAHPNARPTPPMQYMHPGQHQHPVQVGQRQSAYVRYHFPGQLPHRCPQHGVQYNAQAHRHMASLYCHMAAPAPGASFPTSQAQPPYHVAHQNLQDPSAPNWNPQVVNAFQAGFSAARLSRAGITNADLVRSLQEYVATMPREQRQRLQKKQSGIKVEKHSPSPYARGIKVTVLNIDRAVSNRSDREGTEEEPACPIKQEKTDDPEGLEEACEPIVRGSVKIKREPLQKINT